MRGGGLTNHVRGELLCLLSVQPDYLRMVIQYVSLPRSPYSDVRR